MSDEIPYGHIERDLCALAQKRVSDAIMSVLQLHETTGQAYLITLAAANSAIAMWAGTMAAHNGLTEPVDMPSALEALAAVMREKAP